MNHILLVEPVHGFSIGISRRLARATANNVASATTAAYSQYEVDCQLLDSKDVTVPTRQEYIPHVLEA